MAATTVWRVDEGRVTHVKNGRVQALNRPIDLREVALSDLEAYLRVKDYLEAKPEIPTLAGDKGPASNGGEPVFERPKGVTEGVKQVPQRTVFSIIDYLLKYPESKAEQIKTALKWQGRDAEWRTTMLSLKALDTIEQEGQRRGAKYRVNVEAVARYAKKRKHVHARDLHERFWLSHEQAHAVMRVGMQQGWAGRNGTGDSWLYQEGGKPANPRALPEVPKQMGWVEVFREYRPPDSVFVVMPRSMRKRGVVRMNLPPDGPKPNRTVFETSALAERVARQESASNREPMEIVALNTDRLISQGCILGPSRAFPGAHHREDGTLKVVCDHDRLRLDLVT